MVTPSDRMCSRRLPGPTAPPSRPRPARYRRRRRRHRRPPFGEQRAGFIGGAHDGGIRQLRRPACWPCGRSPRRPRYDWRSPPRDRDLDFFLFERRGHSAATSHCETSWSSSAARQGAECATTSPMMRIAGPRRPRGERRQFGEHADHGLRIRPRHAGKHADRRLRRAAGREQAGAHRRRRGHAHVDDDGHLLVGQADQSTVSASCALCAVRKVMRSASWRKVSGTSNCAAEPSPAVMPGTIA